MFFSKQTLRHSTEIVDGVKSSEEDGRIAICTASLIYVLTPCFSKGFENPATTCPLSDSFSFTIANVPKPGISVLKLMRPPFSVNSLYTDLPHLKAMHTGQSEFTKQLDPIFASTMATFTACGWMPVCVLSGSFLCGLTNTGQLLVYSPPQGYQRAWNLEHNISNDLVSFATQYLPVERKAEVGRESGGGHTALTDRDADESMDVDLNSSTLTSGTPTDDDHFQTSRTPDDSAMDEDMEYGGVTAKDVGKAYRVPSGKIVMPTYAHYEKVMYFSTVTGYSWQKDDSLGQSSVWLALGNRTQYVLICSVSVESSKQGRRNKEEEGQSTEGKGFTVEASVKWMHRLAMGAKDCITCVRWKKRFRENPSDASLAVGTSDGLVYLFSQKLESDACDFDVLALITSTTTDSIPVSHLLWCHRNSSKEKDPKKTKGKNEKTIDKVLEDSNSSSMLLFAKGEHIGMGKVTSQTWDMSDIVYVTGCHTLPISGLENACGSHRVISTSLDATVQSFDPWSAWSGKARVIEPNFTVLQPETVPTPLAVGGFLNVQGMCTSRNGIYTCLVSTSGKQMDKKVISEVHFFCNTTAEEGLSLLRDTRASLPTNLYDVLHLLKNYGQLEAAAVEDLVGDFGELSPSEHLQKCYQIAHVLGLSDVKISIGECLRCRLIVSRLTAWLEGGEVSLCSRGTLALSSMCQWLKEFTTEEHQLLEKVLSKMSTVAASNCCICDVELIIAKPALSLTAPLVCPKGHSLVCCSLTFLIPSSAHYKQCVECGGCVVFPEPTDCDWLRSILELKHCAFCSMPFHERL